MADVVEVTDPADRRLADFRDLRDVELRKAVETSHGLFVAEGEKVIRRALAAGFDARSFLMTARWVESLSDVLEATDAPCLVLSDSLIEQVAGFRVHRGALASFARKPLPSIASVLESARTVVVLEDVVDHTNVGAIFRSAAALSVDAVLLSPRCADPLYRRSIKVGMGAVFAVPYARIDSWYDALLDLAALGFATVALALSDHAVPLDHAVAGVDRLALVMGTEGTGLSPRWLATAAKHAVIPMSAGVDSLNVAAATAVACYVAQRR